MEEGKKCAVQQTRSMLCSNATTLTTAVKVGAPPKVLWSILTDLSQIPDIISMVENFEFVEKDPQGQMCREGTQWRETRSHNGTTVLQLKAVLQVIDTDPQYSLKFGISYPELKGFEDSVNISTLTIEPINSNSCYLLGSLVYEHRNCCLRLWDIFCNKKENYVEMFRNELEEYATAAERLSEQPKQK